VQGLKIVRPGKILILDLLSDPTKSGLVLIFATEAVSIHIMLSIKNCIVMSGLLLRSIALNLGIDAATVRYQFNQWRPSPVEQGVTGGDECYFRTECSQSPKIFRMFLFMEVDVLLNPGNI